MSSDYQFELHSLAMAIAALAGGSRSNYEDIIRTLASRLSAQTSLPGVPAPEVDVSKDEARKQAAVRVIAYWKQRCNHAQAKPTPERVRAVLSRLREGYSEAEIRKAIDGAATAAFVNDDGHKYDDLTLICRNGSKLEQFIERGVKATGEIENVVEGDGTTDEEKITTLRRELAALKKQGRATEYENAVAELQRLMARRSA